MSRLVQTSKGQTRQGTCKKSILSLFCSTGMDVKLKCTPVDIVPRGMVNPKNACYMNSVLQCLVHCPPLYHYFRDHLRHLSAIPAQSLPVLRAFLLLFAEFRTCPLNSSQRLQAGKALSPHYFWKLAHSHEKWSMSVTTQGDAQEVCSISGIILASAQFTKPCNLRGGVLDSLGNHARGQPTIRHEPVMLLYTAAT